MSKATSQPQRRRITTSGACVVALALATGFGGGAFAVARTTPPGPAVTGGIHLDRGDVAPGGTVHGELVFENRTARTRVLMRGCAHDARYAIGLRASDGYLQDPAFAGVACGSTVLMVARPGTTVYRFTLPATYINCVQSAKHQPPIGSRFWAPLCRGRSADIMPPLPRGRYTALFFPGEDWLGPHVEAAHLLVR